MDKKATPKISKKRIVRTIVWIVIIAAIVLVGGYFLRQALGNKTTSEAVLTKTTATVKRGDVSRTLGVSATLNSSKTEDHVSELPGEILKINFEEGEYVEAGQVVMVLDTEVTDEAIQAFEDQKESKQQQIYNINDSIDDAYSSIDDQNENIIGFKDDISDLQNEIEDLETDIAENELLRENLNIYAPLDGIVFNIQASEGDFVGTGTLLATITNPLSYEVEMPFSVNFLNYEIEEVIIRYKNSTIPGEIVSYADFTYTDAYGNELVDVVIAFTRFAALPDGARVKGTIVTDPISYKCVTEIAPYYADTENIFPEIQGELLELNLIEKQSVKAGDLIAVIDSETLDNATELLADQISIKNDQILSLNDSIENSMENITQLNENIDDYYDDIDELMDDIADIETDIIEAEEGYISSEVTAGFRGIVTGLTVEAGDDIGTNQKLFTLVSMDNPSMNLTIDELDILEVTVGLDAEVVIEALPDTETNPVPAVVTDIALLGNTQGGVTTYTVTVTLKENPEGFKLGMNATATVFTSQSIDTLFIPIEAVTIINGNSFVWITDTAVGDTGTVDKSIYADKTKDAGAAAGKAAGKRPGAMANKDTSTMTEEQKARYNEYLKNAEKDPDISSDVTADNTFQTEEEYYASATRTPITVGIHNETYIEVLSGLDEGQIVVLPPVYISDAEPSTGSAPGMDLGAARKAMGGIGGGK
ncbi:MAG: biotin/lipoyl-binding protein [Clostridiales bacterium]|nr:biotin/lipoyl-binding protein [Clostridiales bacterium]